MPTVGKTNFQWFQPNESTLSEAFGGDSSQVQAVVQIKGDAATRRQCAADLLEYPVFVVNGKFRYISRHLPLAYPQPFVSGESDDGVQLYASRFAGGKGVGPRGQDKGAPAAGNVPAQVPLPVYQVYQYDLEFTDRTYDLLPDSAIVAASAAIPPPTGVTAVALPRLPGSPFPGLPANTYYAGVTATNAYGETNVVGNLASANLNFGDLLVISWQAVAGATGYKVYAGVAGAGNPTLTLFVGSYAAYTGGVTVGSLPTAAGSPPLTNTTAGPLWDAANNVGYPDEGAALAAGDGQTGSRYITRNSRPGGRGITIPRGFMYYQDTGIGIEQGLLKVVPTTSLIYTWHMVPRAAVPGQAIRNFIGCVNNGQFDGYPPGTLLFDSVDPRRYRSALGGRVLDLQYSFTAQMNIDLSGVAQGHNAALEFIPKAAGNASTVDYVQVRSDKNGEGNPPYRSADFSALFRPTQG